jgi:hypothetical protein
MYLDGFLKLSRLDENLSQIPECVSQLDAISAKYGVDFIISLSMNKDDLADDLQDKVLLAL